jgi:transcriptional regulator with XRE-family HTH domain
MKDKSLIQRILDMRGVRYTWLCEQIGITSVEFNHYETGRRRPPVGYYENVSRVLGVPVDALIQPDETKEKATA